MSIMNLLQALRLRACIERDMIIGTLFTVINRILPKMKPAIKDLTGKTAIVTGGNSGVGFGIALRLAKMGATVVLACRNEKKASQAVQSIQQTVPNASLGVMILDNASFKSVNSFADQWKARGQKIDLLFHNAGITAGPEGQEFSEDGFEFTYQTNFLSSFLLTHLLEPALSSDARIIFTSSVAGYLGTISDNFALSKTSKTVEDGFHTRGKLKPGKSDKARRYGQTKIMQAACARVLQSFFDEDRQNGRLAFSFEPGLVKTNVFGPSLPSFSRDPGLWFFAILMHLVGIDRMEGAASGIHLATSEQQYVLQNKGRYFDRLLPRAHWIDLLSRDKMDRLWVRWCADAGISWT